MVNVLLALNNIFKSRPHPFNMNGVDKLNYYNFEYSSSNDVFLSFSTLLNSPIENIVSGKEILDLGCGAGGKSVYLYEKGAKKVNAIDQNQVLIDQGNKYIEEKSLKDKVILQIGDVTNLNFEDESFDILIANDLMEHVNKPIDMVKESYRVLRKGGLLLINFEPYYNFLGYHMWDKINIPWAHLIFSEETRIQAYKQLIKDLPDSKERLEFRISKESNGKEFIGYLNHITYAKFLKIIKNSDFQILDNKVIMLKDNILGFLKYIPIVREPFIKKVITVLTKK